MRRFGIIGYPLAHSFSRRYFSEFFIREGIDACYDNFELNSLEYFSRVLDSHPDLVGLNVTIPFKQAIIPYLNALSPEAEVIGAVNVIHIQKNAAVERVLTGYNTDVIGFVQSIRPMIDRLIQRLQEEGCKEPLKALVFGTGGASKAICYGLRQLGVEPQPVSRTYHPDTLTYDQLTAEHYQAHRIWVNATPLGMSPHTETCPPIDYQQIGHGFLLFDAVYNPEKTCFLMKGEEAGALIKNGLDMLYGQAEAAWKIWNT